MDDGRYKQNYVHSNGSLKNFFSFFKMKFLKCIRQNICKYFGMYVFLSNVTHFPFYDHHRCVYLCVSKIKERIPFGSTAARVRHSSIKFCLVSSGSFILPLHTTAAHQPFEFIGSIMRRMAKKNTHQNKGKQNTKRIATEEKINKKRNRFKVHINLCI